MARNLSHSLKRVVAGLCAVLVVAGTVPAKFGGLGLFDGTAIVATAEGESSDSSVKECGDAATLKSLLQNSSDGDIIKLTRNFNASSFVGQKVPIKSGCLVTLDLNGHTLTFGNGGDVFGTQANSAFLIKNGTMDYLDTDNNNSAGIIILTNVKVTNTAWLGRATTWLVNNSTVNLLQTESAQVNPGSTLNPKGNNYNGSYNFENSAPAMIGSGTTWACYSDLQADFDKADASTYNKMFLLKNSTLTADANLSAYGLTMDFSEFTLTTNGKKFAVSQESGTSTLRNGTVDGDVDLTVGSGEILFTNMVITGKINNKTHPVEITDGSYNDISTGTGKVTITGGYYKGTLSGDTYDIKGGSFVNKPDEDYLPEGYAVFETNEIVDGVTYKYRVAAGYTVTFDPNGGTTDVTSKAYEKDSAVGTLPAPVYKKHSFDGWYTTAAGGTQIISATTVSSNVTWYAHWTEVYASVVTAPTANDLTYNGSAQQLVTEGAARGGEIRYALGTNAKTAPASGYSTTVPAKKDFGTYYVWYKAAGDADHFDTEPVCITVDIQKKALTVTANAAGKTYGKDDPELSYEVSGLVGNDTVSGKLTREAGEDVGTYAITQGTLAASDNYDLTFTGADFTIDKAEITITADDKSSQYLDDIAELTFTVGGDYVEGDDLGVTLNTEATSESDTGEYDITVAYDNANYDAKLMDNLLPCSALIICCCIVMCQLVSTLSNLTFRRKVK